MAKQPNQIFITQSDARMVISDTTTKPFHSNAQSPDDFYTPFASTSKTIEEVLSTEGYYLGLPNGNSMWPLLRHQKDQFLVVPLTEPLKKNDIALFRIGEKHILHRVVGFYDGGYVMRGDNCINCEYIPHQQVLGSCADCWCRS
ncbi:MAG: S26 family signal peptidase [Eggerthellaceae bacterium]